MKIDNIKRIVSKNRGDETVFAIETSAEDREIFGCRVLYENTFP
jgi:hypothetical protein